MKKYNSEPKFKDGETCLFNYGIEEDEPIEVIIRSSFWDDKNKTWQYHILEKGFSKENGFLWPEFCFSKLNAF